MATITSEALQADIDAFEISEELGFVFKEPLTHLPDYYQAWWDLADNVTLLIELHKLREMVDEMPVLSPQFLSGHGELWLAHMALGFITMGYVWQEGPHAPAQTLPRALALPLCSISRSLGIPPIITYADTVLANWKLKDIRGKMEIGNMDLIFSFPGYESSRGFFIVSTLVEMAASSGVMGALSVMHGMKNSDLHGIERGLIQVTQSLKKMKEEFKLMHDHVDPSVFHGVLRIFLSGWQNNPLLPEGLRYEGVSDEPISLSGASAAQSSVIQCLDVLLCIQHDDEMGAFLTRMRDYMPPAHRRLIETLAVLPPLRDFISSHAGSDLCRAYNDCVSALVDFRNYHLRVVTKFVIVPDCRGQAMGCPARFGGAVQNIKGTSGSDLMVFLKSIRNTTENALFVERSPVSKDVSFIRLAVEVMLVPLSFVGRFVSLWDRFFKNDRKY